MDLRPRAIALLAGGALIVGCTVAPPLPSGPASTGERSDSTPPAAADRGADVARVEALLDVDSADLLTVIERDEDIEVTIDVPNSAAARAAATSAGFRTELVNDVEIVVSGRRDDVLEFVAGLPVTNARLAADQRADRWLPSDRPSVEIPFAGAPYPFARLDVDRSLLQMNEDWQAVMLSELARGAVTIDGRPYLRLSVEGECSGGTRGSALTCTLTASGIAAGSGGRPDTYVIVLDETTGRRPVVASVIRESVPRALERAAEWIARHDPTAASEISGYDTCCNVSWRPGQPGVITLRWLRPCSASAAPPRVELAETGDCFESLAVVVDVGRGAVLSTAAEPGP